MMLERILKTVLIIMLMVIFMQRIVSPAISEAVATRAHLNEVRLSLQDMASSERERVGNILRTEKQMISAYLNELSRLLPDFSDAKVDAIADLESLRNDFAGEWQIQPSAQPLILGELVSWTIRISFSGDFQTALNALEAIESHCTPGRIAALDFALTNEGKIRLSLEADLLFRNSDISVDKSAFLSAIPGGEK